MAGGLPLPIPSVSLPSNFSEVEYIESVMEQVTDLEVADKAGELANEVGGSLGEVKEDVQESSGGLMSVINFFTFSRKNKGTSVDEVKVEETEESEAVMNKSNDAHSHMNLHLERHQSVKHVENACQEGLQVAYDAVKGLLEVQCKESIPPKHSGLTRISSDLDGSTAWIHDTPDTLNTFHTQGRSSLQFSTVFNY